MDRMGNLELEQLPADIWVNASLAEQLAAAAGMRPTKYHHQALVLT